MKLIHLTDPHLVAPGTDLYQLDPEYRLRKAIANINQHHADAEVCIITGDLADIADPTAYDILKDLLLDLVPPWHIIIGNHDDRDTVKTYFPNIASDSNGFLQSVVECSEGKLFLLDTVQAGTHRGAYCEERCAWLDKQLTHFADENVFLFSHHPPFKVGIPVMDKISIGDDDTARLNSVMKRHKNVRHLFFGHLHRPVHGSWLGISFSTIRSTNHQVWLDFTSTEEIPGSHEPPAYAVALIEGNQIVIHNHDYMDSSPKFTIGGWRK